MAYDEGLAQRLEAIMGSNPQLTETRMFGGFGYLMHGNMCVGIYKDQLIIRVGKPCAEKVLAEKHVHPMDITGKPMKAWARIAPEGMTEDEDLERFCGMALDFVGTLPRK